MDTKHERQAKTSFFAGIHAVVMGCLNHPAAMVILAVVFALALIGALETLLTVP